MRYSHDEVAHVILREVTGSHTLHDLRIAAQQQVSRIFAEGDSLEDDTLLPPPNTPTDGKKTVVQLQEETSQWYFKQHVERVMSLVIGRLQRDARLRV